MRKIITAISIITIIFSCEKEEVVKPLLLDQIEKYINISESQDKETYSETNIYLVKFFTINAKEYVNIFESDFYVKENLDGYINIKDNKVFFYDSNEFFVKSNLLKNNRLEKVPDENSKEAQNIFDPINWYFIIDEKNQLKKITNENFIIDWNGNIYR